MADRGEWERSTNDAGTVPSMHAHQLFGVGVRKACCHLSTQSQIRCAALPILRAWWEGMQSQVRSWAGTLTQGRGGNSWVKGHAWGVTHLEYVVVVRCPESVALGGVRRSQQQVGPDPSSQCRRHQRLGGALEELQGDGRP